MEIKKKKKSKHLETVESGCQGIGEIGRVWLKDDIRIRSGESNV